jgi:hypothetical protein
VTTSVHEGDGPYRHPVSILDIERCAIEEEASLAQQAIDVLQLLVDGDAARQELWCIQGDLASVSASMLKASVPIACATSTPARDTRDRP